METANTTQRENCYLNHFHALNSLLLRDNNGELTRKFNTDALIKIFHLITRQRIKVGLRVP